MSAPLISALQLRGVWSGAAVSKFARTSALTTQRSWCVLYIVASSCSSAMPDAASRTAVRSVSG